MTIGAPPRFLARSLVLVVLAAGALLVGACASGTSTGTTTSADPTTRSPAGQACDRGDYRTALKEAEAEYRRSSGPKREAAALTAGLSAHALDDDTTARKWLTPLVDSSDRQIAGRASAALGLIEADAGNNERAVVLLTDAARALPGNAGARAEFYAAESYAHMGRLDAARAGYRLAATRATDAELKQLIAERLKTGGYTIQLGAFKSVANAQKMIAEVRGKCAAAGIGDPRVVARSRPGAPPLQTVQVGRFSSPDEAKRALMRLGVQGIVTTTSVK